MKRMMNMFLALCMCVSTLMMNGLPTVSAVEKLVNIAPNGTATTESTTVSGSVNALKDENADTQWQTSSWPSQAVIQLDGGHMVKKVVVKLGANSANENVNVTITYAQNGVTSDLIAFGSTTAAPNSDAVIALDIPVSATHIYVSLSDANGAVNGQTIAIKEIEVYEAIDVELSAYNNIAAQAVITTDGSASQKEGSANLVDKNQSTLYKFHDAQQTSEKYILLSYAEARTMDAVVIKFEDYGNSDSLNFQFNYSILAQNSKTDGSNWDVICENQIGNRTTASNNEYSFNAKTYDKVKIVMHSCTTKNGYGWPAIAEFEVYGNEIVVEDNEAVSNGKPVHVSSGKNTASNIVDGSKTTNWKGAYYPAYADIDLEANYDLSAIEVYTPAEGYSQYSIYTSLNGRDFTKLAEKTTKASASLENGERYTATGTTARYVRIYMEYNSASTQAVLNEVRVLGKASSKPAQDYPTLNVPKFEGSAYDVEITAQDTYEEIYGIIDRRLGTTYRDWFSFELTADQANGYDYFEISSKEGKVHIKGNEGVSITMGLNHYLKYLCNVHISQVGDQVTMPEAIVLPKNPIHMETKAKVRYSYNYCTLSYSMAFYGEKEWRDELDWLALNGANVILDATAQEEVWRRFLGKLGYDHASAKDYIAGPAYYAWAYMANLSGFGGPVHDSWFVERTELARKNQLAMRKLGMEPCLQGYSGMVPTDIRDYDANANIIAQGNWCSFQRPAMLRTTDAKFDEYAALFYACQKEVYGDVSNYYATDPFHEGGITGGMNSADISREVLNSMLAADQDAIWIIQAWQGNPTTALLNGLDQVTNGASHALVLDLYAEKDPHNQQTGGSYGDTKEFDDTPWVYCMLNNFGGRLGLHGHLDHMAREIPVAFNRSNHLAGIGITPEASVNNPVLYDFIFESCWVEDATATMETIDLTSWLKAYATRRYGAQSDNADEAWMILKDTVYKASLNMNGQGSPESIVNARPALSISAASTWGNAIISYDKVLLEDALELLLKDYDQFKDNEAYMYDIANVEQQVLSNSAQEVHRRMAAAFNARDLVAFEKEANTFMEIIERMELVTGTTKYFMLGRWVEMAKDLAKNADDFTKDLYEFNAKAIVTTWGSYNQAEGGKLKDYSNRQWNGLIGDFYKARWERWIEASKMKIQDPKYDTTINWFEWEWAWARANDVYTNEPTPQDLKALGEEMLEKYTSANPAADASKDVPTSEMSVKTGSYQPNNETEGDPNYVLDGNPGTIWHSNWNGSTRDQQYLEFTFDSIQTIDSMRFLQRSGTNGCVRTYSLYYRASESGAWLPIVENGSLDTVASWQQIKFDAIEAKQIKFQVVDAMSTTSTLFGAAAEVRFTKAELSDEVNKDALQQAITTAEAKLAEADLYTADTIAHLQTVLNSAKAVYANTNATQVNVNAATLSLNNAINALKVKEKELGNLINTSANSGIVALSTTSEYPGETKDKTLDYNNASHWHTNWSDGSQTLPQSITYDLGKTYNLSDITFLPRQDGSYNGDITEMKVYVGDSVNNLTLVGTFTFEKGNAGLTNRTEFKRMMLDASGRYVKVEATKSAADSTQNKFASIAEIRFYEKVEAPVVPEVDKTALEALVDYANGLNEFAYKDFMPVTDALSEASGILAKENATQAEVDEVVNMLNNAIQQLREYASLDDLRIVDITDTSMVLMWTPHSEDIVKYRIYDTLTNELLVETTELSYTFTGLMPETEYVWTVNPVDADGDQGVGRMTGAWTNETPKLPTNVENVKAEDTDYKTITLTWDASEHATAYDVYRKSYDSDEFKLYKTVEATRLAVSGVMTGKEYAFYVVAKNEAGVAEASATVTKATTLHGEVTLDIEKVSTSTFKLSWNKIDGATRYIVYRKRNDDKMKKVLTLGADKLEYTTAEMPNGEYEFQVRAGRYDSKDRVMTGASNKETVTVEKVAPAVTLKTGTKSVTVSWKAMEGVTHYQVYRATSKDGKYTKLTTTKELSYKAKSLSSGKKYFFKVRGYKLYKSGDDIKYNVYTPYSTVKYATAK